MFSQLSRFGVNDWESSASGIQGKDILLGPCGQTLNIEEFKTTLRMAIDITMI